MQILGRWVLIAAITMLGNHLGHCGSCTVFEKNSGCTLQLNPGDSLSVQLAGNITTGYQWEIVAVDKLILRPAGEPEYAADSKAIGAGGMYTFRFEAVTTGSACLKMIYHRPWEKNVAPLRTFQVSVIIANDKPGCQTQGTHSRQ